jgi:hypothetical protein
MVVLLSYMYSSMIGKLRCVDSSVVLQLVQ